MRLLPFIFFLCLSEASAKTEKLYDFDHQVHFEIRELANDQYRIAIKPGNYAFFETQSAFLMRKSARLCGRRAVELTIISGVQPFEKFPVEPRAYPGKLVANIRCVSPDNPKE